MANKLTFKDRDDLISQLIVKKSDIPEASKILAGLAEALKRYKKGDKKAMQTVVKLRKQLLSASAEVYIELEEDNMYNAVVAELNVLNLIEDED